MLLMMINNSTYYYFIIVIHNVNVLVINLSLLETNGRFNNLSNI